MSNVDEAVEAARENQPLAVLLVKILGRLDRLERERQAIINEISRLDNK